MSATQEKAAPEVKAPAKGRANWVLVWRRLRRNRSALVGLGIVILLVVVAALAGVIAPYSFDRQFDEAWQVSPGWPHVFGTDGLGRDIFSRIVYGARVSLLVGVTATAISVVIGAFVGAIAGYYPGFVDNLLMRVTDAFFAFPGILLAIGIIAIFEKPDVYKIFFALGLVGWTGYARIVRAQVLTLRGSDYVTAARALGAGDLRIIFRHILPNSMGPIVVVATLGVAGNILAEAGLSFLGVGIQDPLPSWGGMLQADRQFWLDKPWMGIIPGLAIMITVLGYNLLGDGLRDAIDPKMKTE